MKFSKRRRRYLKTRIPVLRNKGLSNREIAHKLGISERSIYRLVPSSQYDSTDFCEAVFFAQGSAHATLATKKLAVKVLGFGMGLKTTGWLFGRSVSSIVRWRAEVRRIQNSSSSVLRDK